ncbi:MAG: gamma carbonic anhydrase family protein [Deltaproteobacteria bacterium HGW-Deltaproteobacteria-6]|nr:MAG: gamma carbonic anhydrase family protein [Deltaproteobacteria bacterium HGW-Deltaproteobacteria-6]
MKTIIPFEGKEPLVSSAFIAPNCCLVGDVVLKEGSSVWFGTVIRGDRARCEIGRGTVVLEQCYVENSIVGDETMLSHGVIVHKAKIGNDVLIGIGARVINGAEIGDHCLIGAGAFILPNTKIPPNSIVIGKGIIIRTATEKDIQYIRDSVKEVQDKAILFNKTIGNAICEE